MFPLPEEEMSELNIERCFRVMPHDQNTGGFFVTVIKKNSFVYFSDVDAEKARKREQNQSDQADLAYEAIKENAGNQTNLEDLNDMVQSSDPNPESEVIKLNKANREYFRLSETMPADWECIKSYYQLKDDTIKDLLYIHQVGEKQVTLVSEKIDNLFKNDNRYQMKRVYLG